MQKDGILNAVPAVGDCLMAIKQMVFVHSYRDTGKIGRMLVSS